MKQDTQRLLVSAFLGGALGTFVAIATGVFFWWIGMLVGMLLFTGIYARQDIEVAVPKAWKATVVKFAQDKPVREIRKKKIVYFFLIVRAQIPCFIIGVFTVLLGAVSFIVVELSLIDFFTEKNINSPAVTSRLMYGYVYTIPVSLAFGVLASFYFSLMEITGISVKRVAEIRRRSGRRVRTWNPYAMTKKGISYATTTIIPFVGHFISHLFRLIVSENLLIGLGSVASAVAIGYFVAIATTSVIGITVGGLSAVVIAGGMVLLRNVFPSLIIEKA